MILAENFHVYRGILDGNVLHRVSAEQCAIWTKKILTKRIKYTLKIHLITSEIYDIASDSTFPTTAIIYMSGKTPTK